MVSQNNRTLKEIIFAAKPMVWVYAQGELSLITSLTCQKRRTDERMYPIKAIIQVNSVASAIKAYCDRAGIFPHWIGPATFAPLSMARFKGIINRRQDNVVATWGTDRPIRTLAGMKYP